MVRSAAADLLGDRRLSFRCSGVASIMVGPPKSLYDLRCIEAAIRVTCRACGAVTLCDLEVLIAKRTRRIEACDWAVVCASLRCTAPGCGSDDVRADGVPFARHAPELRRQHAIATTVRLAYPGGRAAMPREAVRLVLRVHPHVVQPQLLAQSWEQFTKEQRLAHEGPAKALSRIVQRLAQRGYLNAEEHR